MRVRDSRGVRIERTCSRALEQGLSEVRAAWGRHRSQVMSRRTWWALLSLVGIAGAGVFMKAAPHQSARPLQLSAPDAGYCSLVKTYKSAFGTLAPGSGAASGDQLVQATALVERAKEGAPPAIKADTDGFAGAYDQVARALAATNYRPATVGLDALQLLQTPAFATALRHIADFDKQTCGIG